MPAKKRTTVTRKRKATKNNLGNLVKKYVLALDERKWCKLGHFGGTIGTSTSTWQFQSLLVSYDPTTGAEVAGIPQGTDQNSRIGNKIKLVRFDFFVFLAPLIVSTETNGSVCRIVVFRDKQCNGALPGATTVFDQNQFETLQNEDQRHRFTMLKDTIHTFVPTATNTTSVSASAPMTCYQFSIPCKTVIEYNGSSGKIATIVKDNYVIGFVSDTANCCQLDCIIKPVYTDA